MPSSGRESGFSKARITLLAALVVAGIALGIAAPLGAAAIEGSQIAGRVVATATSDADPGKAGRERAEVSATWQWNGQERNGRISEDLLRGEQVTIAVTQTGDYVREVSKGVVAFLAVFLAFGGALIGGLIGLITLIVSPPTVKKGESIHPRMRPKSLL